MATTVVVAAILKGLGMANETAMGTAVALEVLSTVALIIIAHTYTRQWTSTPSTTTPPLDRIHRWILGLGVLCVILAHDKRRVLRR